MPASVVDWYGRHLGLGRDDSHELSALEEFPAFAASPSDLIFRGADGLCRASAGFHCQQVAFARRCHEAKHAVGVPRDLNQDYTLAGSREVINLVSTAKECSCLLRCNDQDLFASRGGDTDDLGAFRGTSEPAAGTGAGFDERLEAKA